MKLNQAKDDSQKPICPFCEEELGEVNCRKLDKRFLDTDIANKLVIFCPHCRKVLGFGMSI